MTSAPASLTALGKFWTDHGGVNLGIVGNKAHVKGYHLGRDRIYAIPPGVGSLDYSVQIQRDRSGLTNAASAIDLGKLNGSYTQLQAFSRWLVIQCTNHEPGWTDVREIIYSPNGDTVQRWSGEDGHIHTGPGNGDSSHRSHTHISYYRDSQGRSKLPLFAPYFVKPPDTGTPGDGMGLNIEANELVRIKVPAGEDVFDLAGVKVGTLSAAVERTIYHRVNITGDGRHFYLGQFPGGGPGPDLLMVRVGPAIELGTPPTECEEIVLGLKAQIAALAIEVAQAANDERDRIAEAEAERIKAI